MYECSIKGCTEVASVLNREYAQRWIRLRACQCGAHDLREPKSCTCRGNDFDLIPTTYWPNLDWWILGGVEEVILCPYHRREVLTEIVHQQTQDPSMTQTAQNPGNVH